MCQAIIAITVANRCAILDIVPNFGPCCPDESWHNNQSARKGVTYFMKENIYISGFADEISPDFTEQLKTVTSLGMHYISLRSADGKNIAEYTPDEVREKLMPRLAQYGVKVSSIGSPVGKVGVEDEAGFAEHLAGLERLCEICKLLDCRYIRMFSFFIPHGKDPDSYRDVVIEKLRKFAAVAEKHDVILLHENEKDIYGDTGARCRVIFEALASPHFRAAFDFANFVQCGEDTEKCWELLRPYIEYIHIKGSGRRASRFRRTPRGSRSLRTRFPTRRRRTSWRLSATSSGIWRSRRPWTGCCAATWATARRRWRCGRP